MRSPGRIFLAEREKVEVEEEESGCLKSWESELILVEREAKSGLNDWRRKRESEGGSRDWYEDEGDEGDGNEE